MSAPGGPWAARRRLVGSGLAGLAVALVLAGCGVPTGGRPAAIPAKQVPANLFAPLPRPTTAGTVPTANLVSVRIYLLTGTTTAAVARYVEFPAALDAVLGDLVQGPTAAEAQAGYTTAIPTSTTVLGAQVANGVATVNFSSAFGQVSGASQVLAVTQVVLTVVGELGITTGVRFEIEGQPFEVPVAGGALQPGPIYLWQVLPGAAPATTTTTSPAADGA